LRGLRLFLATVAQIREALNPELQTVGVLVTFYAPRLTHHQEALALLEGSGLPLLSVKVGRSVRVAEAAATGQTILTYGPNNPQAAAYRDLGKEVLAWLQGNAQP
jgi:chromosome partitioning protein